MTNMNEDKLLRTFFEANKKEVPDNGFSKKVMKRLPKKESQISKVWTCCCALLAIVAFVLLETPRIIIETFTTTLSHTVENGVANLDPKTMIIVSVVVLSLGVGKLLSTD